MKFLKGAGVVLLLAALCLSLGIIGRVDFEDQQYHTGQIELTEMLSDSKLIGWIGVAIGLAVLGGLMFVIRFFIQTRHLPLVDYRHRAVQPTAERPFSTLLSYHVPLVDEDYIGIFELEGYIYALHLTEDGIYVITDRRDNNLQYWSGDISALKALEAYYDDVR